MNFKVEALEQITAAGGGDRQSASQLRFVYGIAAVAALGGFLFGFDTAVINGAIVFLKRDFLLSDFQTEAAASSILFGCAVGASFAGLLCDRFGRKRILLSAAVMFLCSALGAAVPMNLMQFVFARFLGGLAIGVASMLSPLYIAEIAPAKIRGRLVTLNQMAIVSGILVAYVVNWGLSGIGEQSWRWMFASAAIPSVFFFLALLFLPESPRWLIQKGRAQEAKEILVKVSGQVGATAQMLEMQKTISIENGSFKELFNKKLRLPLLIGVGLAILQQVTGINTILYYGSILFTEHANHQSASSALGANAVIGLINFVGTVLALWMIDRVGRKKLIMVTSAGMALSLFALGFAFKSPEPSNGLLLSLILSYVAFFAVGPGPAVWVLMSELFPTHIRGKAMSLATISLWIACLGISFSFLTLLKQLGPSVTFWLYGAMSVVMLVFVATLAPETRGKTLEEIEHSWR